MSDLVPEEAIEAACLAMNDGVWSSHHRERWEPQVMTVLSAAAPLILAAELELLAAELGKRDTIPNDQWDRGHQDGLETAAAALRARASVLRGEGDPK